MATELFKHNLTADGQTPEVNWPGGTGTFAVYGTFGSGTAKLQVSLNEGSTWLDVGTDTEFTANGIGNYELPPGSLLRADLSGATDPDLTVDIRQSRRGSV